MDNNNYIAQRLAAIGAAGNNNAQSEVETLRAKVAQLEKQLEQAPQANFKSEAQVAFEQSPEFDNILNVFYMRFVRDKFGAEFRTSPYLQEFQAVANQAFAEFEKAYKTDKKEAPKNGTQVSKKSGRTAGDGNAPTGENDG